MFQRSTAYTLILAALAACQPSARAAEAVVDTCTCPAAPAQGWMPGSDSPSLEPGLHGPAPQPWLTSWSQTLKADSCDCDHAGPTKWIYQLLTNGFRVHDPAVCYPRFPLFCLKVYNWGDRTFNSYDQDYVVGTGKNWKLQGKSYNWMETSSIVFPKEGAISMHSQVYSDAGFSLSFMALSISYMWNVNKIFHSAPVGRRTFNFDFTCSRFAVNYQAVSSSGGMTISRFGEYDRGESLSIPFDNTSTRIKQFDAYWFFNHNHYSQAAAYSFSKYQLRSSGTALVGLDYSQQRITMDFSLLPAEMLEFYPSDNYVYSSNYRSYCALGGYAYNLVLKPRRWLFNVTGMMALGYKQLRDTEQRHPGITRLAHNFRFTAALVYNHRALFAALTGRGQAFINYSSSDITHFNSVLSLTASVGMRF